MTMQKIEQPNSPAHEPVSVGSEGDSVHDYALRPPLLKLGQAQSGDGTPGLFRRTDNGEEFETIDVIALRIQATRLKYPGGAFSRDRKPDCWSNDGRYGDPKGAFPGQECTTCQFRLNSIWEAEAQTDMCIPTHVVFFLEAYSFEPLVFQINSKSAARLASIIRSNLRKTRMHLYVEPVKIPSGNFFAPRLKTIEKLAEDDLAQVNEMLDLLARDRMVATVEDEQEASHHPKPEEFDLVAALKQAKAQGAEWIPVPDGNLLTVKEAEEMVHPSKK